MKKNKLKIPKNFKFHSNNLPAFTKFFLAQKKNSAEFYFSVSHKKLFSDKFFFLLIKILLNEFFYSTLVFPLGNFFHEFHTIFFLLNLFLSARFHYFSPEFFLLLSLTSADYPLYSTCRCISYLLATFNIRKHFFKFRPDVVFLCFLYRNTKHENL